MYLDYAAATPLADFVLSAMQPYFSDQFYNPSSPYAPAVAVRRDYEAAKQRLAETFGGKADEIIITAGATESINLAMNHVKGHIVSSSIEHQSVLEVVKKYDHTLVEVESTGRVQPEAVQSAIRPDTELVTIALANSELGTLQPLRKIAEVIRLEREKRAGQGNTTPLLLHSDSSQGFGQIDIHVARLGIDLLTLNAGKIYGPKQVGLLWTKRSTEIEAMIVGGGQEGGLRSGTENVAGVIGFAEAAVWAAKHQAAENKRLKVLRDRLQEKLTGAFSDAAVLGSTKLRLPSFLSIAFPDIDAERIIFMLETKGVFVATGSACSANKHTASHILKAINVDDRLISGSFRLTLGKQTTEKKIDIAAREIINALKSEYKRIKQ